MATHTCNQNCGCTNSYTVTAPCPPACSEVFNSSCIVYTGTDITCNTDTVIKRYDYLDTIITKLVNYICNVQAPITQVVGSTYIDVVPNTIGNVTTFTVSVDIAQLDVYFANAFQNDLFASILAGPGIAVATNALTGTVTISHQDTSSVSNLSSDNSGNSFIQDIFFTFDTFGHVTGASVIPGTVTPPNDFDRAQINPDSGFVWGPDNDPTNIQIAEAPGDTLNFVAGTGIVLNASTVPSTDAIRITNSDPGSAVTLTSAGGTSLVNDGTGPALAVKGLQAGSGMSIANNLGNTILTLTNTAPNVDQNLWLTFEGDTGLAINATTTTDALTVTGANGISTNTTGTTLTITNTDPGSAVTLADAGTTTHESLVNDGTGPALATKGLKAGTGIALSSTGTDITITNTGSGSAVTLSGVGSGQSIINDGVGPDLVTKSISSGAGITVTGNATDLFITNSAPKFVTFSATTGSTTANTTTDILTVVGAGGITTSITGDTLTITGSGGGGVGKYITTTPTISGGGSIGINHNLNTPHVILSVTLLSTGFAMNPGVDYSWVVVDNDNITINDSPLGSWTGEPVRVTVIG